MLPIPLGLEGGGFHFVGASSVGKTTCLNVAASVVGHRKLTQWNTTVNGLEAVAEAHNHLMLPLDEIGQSYPKDVAQAAYLLANGAGKQRMTKTLQTRKPKGWRVLFLSSGEIGLAQYLKDGGINVKSGQEARMPNIPAVPSTQSYGVFECIHGYESPARFVADLEISCRENRGAVLDAFLGQFVEAGLDDASIAKFNRDLWAKTQSLTGDISDEVIGRAAKRFALIWLALELAHGYGLLPIPIGQCEWAIRSVFGDWISARGGVGSIEIKQALERIEHEFVTSEFSDRILNLDNRSNVPTRNLFAYSKKDIFTDEPEFWVPPAVFRQLTNGVDRDTLISEMQRREWLKAGDSEGKAALLRRIQGKKTRLYVFNRFWNSEIPGVPGVPGVPGEQNPFPEGILGAATPGTPKKDQVFQVFQTSDQNGESGTPGTPQENQVFHSIEPQNPYPEGASESGTPGTPGTPQKHTFLENAIHDDVGSAATCGGLEGFTPGSQYDDDDIDWGLGGVE